MQSALLVVIHAVDVGAGIWVGIHALDVTAYKTPAVSVAIVFAQIAVSVAAQFVAAFKQQISVWFFDKAGIGHIGYRHAGFEFIGVRSEISGCPCQTVVIGQTNNRTAIMQRIVVMVIREVNAAVFFAYTHGDHVMGIIATVFVWEHHFVPLAGR